jgi:uncharacterized damage-inducible protein DinB
MDDAQATLAVLFRGWHDYQGLLITALTPLSDEQLALRAAPHLRSMGEIVTHMIGARARWFYLALSIGGDVFAGLAQWDRRGMPARSARELITGLQTTWQTMQEAIASWTPAEWAQVYDNDPGDEPAQFTRRWIVWHLIEHDLHHGGEVSLMLGTHGLAAPDL